MTEEDKQLLKEFLRGAGPAVAVMAVFILFIVLTNQTQPTEPTQPTEATVVDTYKGCDIIRWSNGQLAEYKYFLHCNNTRPVYGK